jgi:hypothetical protein
VKIFLILVLLLSLSVAGCHKAGTVPHSVEISWKAAAPPPTYYEVFRTTTRDREVNAATKPYAPRVDGTNFIDNDVVAGETYFYRVRSVIEDNKGVHKSELSPEITAVVPKP